MNPHSMLSHLQAVAEFATWQQRVASIEGWLHDLEGYCLFHLAGHGPGLGEIVEIGSYMGRSTAWLAAGTKTWAREKVTAIDHFQGSPEHQCGQPWESAALRQEGSNFGQFMENLRRLELDDYVTPIVATSEQAAAQWKNPVRLLFIDGDHSYEASKRDFELMAPFVIRQGIICFHDINAWPGVTRFYDELKQNTAYREVASVVSIRVIQKC